MEKILNITIEELDFSPQTYVCLKRSNINTIEDLIQKPYEEMIEVKNLGKKNLDEIINKLAILGLNLK